MDTYGLPLTRQGSSGEVNLLKTIEILIKKNNLLENEAVYMYKTLTKCISNAVRLGKKIIKKRGLAALKKVVYLN